MRLSDELQARAEAFRKVQCHFKEAFDLICDSPVCQKVLQAGMAVTLAEADALVKQSVPSHVKRHKL